jgi:uncharacterized membrane protein
MVLFYPTAVTSQVIAGRFSAFDRLRGLIMIIMAIDHASFFIARVHFYEAWSTFPAEPVTFTRWITHLCAPGFFMLMGASMVARQGAPEGRLGSRPDPVVLHQARAGSDSGSAIHREHCVAHG